jgi:hypothetical protein
MYMPFNENSTLKQISQNEKAKAILAKYLPGIWEHPLTKLAMNYSLKALSGFPQAAPYKEKLPEILKELSEIE